LHFVFPVVNLGLRVNVFILQTEKMKRLFLFLLALLLLPVPRINGQNVGINSTGSAPNASAGLDVDFTNMGVLIPRMTTAQRNAIASPANSLMIFNTTTNCVEIYLGGVWQSLYCGCSGPPAAPVANAATALTSTGFSANWASVANATNYYLDVSTSPTFGTFVAGYNNLSVGNVLT
jgi:hypothetical protein